MNTDRRLPPQLPPQLPPELQQALPPEWLPHWQPRKPWVAGLMSLALPGWGQLYNGQANRAIWCFLTFSLLLQFAAGCWEGDGVLGWPGEGVCQVAADCKQPGRERRPRGLKVTQVAPGPHKTFLRQLFDDRAAQAHPPQKGKNTVLVAVNQLRIGLTVSLQGLGDELVGLCGRHLTGV